MTTNLTRSNTGTYGTVTAGAIGPLMQGQAGVVMQFTMTTIDGTAINLTGKTITGTLQNTQTKATAAIAGAIALVTPASGIFSWTTDADDVGTAGNFKLTFTDGAGLITFPLHLSVVTNPSADTTFSAALVGVTVAEAAWLAAALAALPDAGDLANVPDPAGATDGYVWTADGADSADWEALPDAASDVNDLTTTTGNSTEMVRVAAAGGLEYRTTAQVLSDIGAAATASLANYLPLTGGTLTGGVTMNPGSGTALTINPAFSQIGLNITTTGNFPLVTAGAGTAAQFTSGVAATNTIQRVVNIIAAGGTATAGFGGSVHWFLKSSTTDNTDAGRIVVVWYEATHASRKADMVLYVSDSSAEREGLRIRANGSGATLYPGGEVAMADQLITRPVIKDYGETVNAIGSIGGGTQDIDLTLGNVVSGTVDTSTTTFTFSNPPASGTNGSFTLYLTNGGSQTVNWPAAVKWAGGTAPTLTASGVDILTFTTLDGGTTWYGFPAGLDMK